jgi:hypothetical protein
LEVIERMGLDTAVRDGLVRILAGAVRDDVEMVFDDSVRALTAQDGRVAVEFERGAPREVTVSPRLCCCFAALRCRSTSAIPPPRTSCCVGALPE